MVGVKGESMSEVKVSVHQEDEQGNVYTLLEPISYTEWDDNELVYRVSVPVGFKSDGASVPRFFWRLVFPPGDSRAMFAAFIHDYLYRKHPFGWTREMADALFYKLLVKDGVPKWRAWLAYKGVRLFGSKAWNAGGEK